MATYNNIICIALNHVYSYMEGAAIKWHGAQRSFAALRQMCSHLAMGRVKPLPEPTYWYGLSLDLHIGMV